MTRFEAIICALAIEEYSDSQWRIREYTGRGCTRTTYGIVADSAPVDIMAMAAGYVLGKTLEELAETIINERHMFVDFLEIDEEELSHSIEVLADTLDGELEFVNGLRSDSMGKQWIVY